KLNDLGAQSIGVPGTLLGLKRMHERYGRLPWPDVLAPAISWARDGYFVRPAMYAFWIDEPIAGRVANRDRLTYSPSGRELYCRFTGTPETIGAPLRSPDYAAALELIARDGARTCYCGDVAEQMVSDLRNQGGILSMEDLAAYQPQVNSPLIGTYRNRRIT